MSVARRRAPWLAGLTGLYLVWSLAPVLIAVLFSFNAGRSRTQWQGFSFQWYYGEPERSVWADQALQTALVHTFRLGVLVTLIAVPLGTLMALGLDRWRGRLPTGASFLTMLSFVLPEILLAIALLFVATAVNEVFTTPVQLGTMGQVIGLVTFQLSYPVIIVRARLLTIGRQYEEAAVDLGASPLECAAPGAAADGLAGDPRQRGAGVRRRDRRLRAGALPVRRLCDRAGLGEDLQHRPCRPHAGAQRDRHAGAGRLPAGGAARLPGLSSDDSR